jgi:hypothetical protein
MLAVLAVVACGGSSTPNVSAQASNSEVAQLNADILSINQEVKQLRAAEPQAKPTDSANLHIQNAWYTAEGDPHKIWYGELLSSSGTLIQAYVTQGPAVDASDQVTNPFQPIWNSDDSNSGASVAGVAIGLAEPDGTYDSNSPELLYISASGAIGRIWVGNAVYVQQDRPFTTTQTPLLTENLSKPITATDTSKTKNAYVPTATSAR